MKWEKQSKYYKCLRVVAWICQCKSNLSKRIRGLTINTDPIPSGKEIRTAEKEINKLVQREEFAKEYTMLMRKDDRSSYKDIMLQSIYT